MKSKGISKIIGLLLAACVTVSAFPLTFAACADSAAAGEDANPKSFRVMDLQYTEPAENTIANPFPDRSPGSSSNTKGFAVNNSFGTKIDYMSLGAQAMRSKNGFSVHPAKGSAGDKADFKIDLTQLSDQVTFFNTVVGLDDLGPMWRLDGLGGSVQCFVLADGRVIATSDVLYPGDMQNLSCDIPEGTRELVLRTSNADGNNYMDNCDWAEPTLYTSRKAFGQVSKSGYSEDNDFGNRTLQAGYAVGMRFSAKESFSSITLRPIMAGEKVDFNIYRFTYSYERSIQNGTLTSVSAKRSSDGSYVFPLNYAFEPGEYLVVFDGVTRIKGNGSQYGYTYLDGVASHGFINMDVTFAATGDSYFASVRLSRQQARDEAINLLQEAASVSGDSKAAESAADLEDIVQTALSEAQIESLIIAKGYADCVAYMTNDGISVAVSAPEGGLQQQDVAVIADVVMSQSGYGLDSIRVVEVR